MYGNIRSEKRFYALLGGCDVFRFNFIEFLYLLIQKIKVLKYKHGCCYLLCDIVIKIIFFDIFKLIKKTFFYQNISSIVIRNIFGILEGTLDDIPIYPDSIHGVNMWRYPDHGSTFGSVHGCQGLVGCPFGSRIPRKLFARTYT